MLFGVPGGGANLDMVGAAVDAGMQFVLTHGETPAAIMAGAYAELTGNPGACVVTRGPGAASAVNGAAQAQLDRQPLIVVTDSVSPSDASRISHQRLDQRTLYAPIAKRSIRIGDDRAEELAASAVELALAPPAGVVHVDVAPDDLSDPGAFAQPPTSSKAAVAEARELLARSEFPVLLIGVGARGAHEEIRRLIQHTACPVLTTYKAKGIIPESWPNACGLLTGATIEAPVIEAADLIVGIGLDPVELIAVPWSYKTPMVLLGEWYVDADYFGPALEVVGPLRDLLPLAGEAVTRGSGAAELRAGYLAQRRRLEARAAGLAPHGVVAAVRDVFEDAIVAIDAGAHMLVAMALWETERPGAVLISSGLATMGFALPAAIAAAIAQPGPARRLPRRRRRPRYDARGAGDRLTADAAGHGGGLQRQRPHVDRAEAGRDRPRRHSGGPVPGDRLCRGQQRAGTPRPAGDDTRRARERARLRWVGPTPGSTPSSIRQATARSWRRSGVRGLRPRSSARRTARALSGTPR